MVPRNQDAWYHESWYQEIKIPSRARPSGPNGSLSRVGGETLKWTILASKMYLKITLRNYCPKVAKMVPMGAKVDPRMHPEAIKIPPEIVVKRDIEKGPVSDASKYSKHSSRAGGSTVFTRPKDQQNVPKIMPKGTQKRHKIIKHAVQTHARNHFEISHLLHFLHRSMP